MEEKQEETLSRLFFRTIMLLRNHSTITPYQLKLRLATDSIKAQKIYTRLKEKQIIKEERWEDKPGERKTVGILDKKRLKEIKEDLMKKV